MLVLDFQAGQPQAFVEIHRRYGRLARHVCQRVMQNQADADEALQETMIRVFQGLYRFNGRYALRPWIARIAKNVSLDILRARARRPLEDGVEPAMDEWADPRDETDVIVERLVLRDTMLEVLAVLPESHRRALVLREIDGRSHREIAHEMEISPAQAKALIHRAKGSFRKGWLEKVTGDGGLRAIAFLPLLWLVRAGGIVRRLGDRVGQSVGHATQAAQTAQTATSEALTTVMGSAAPAGAGLAERVVAAGMTLLVAGGVTVGAAKIVQDRNRPEPVVVAAAAAEAPDTVTHQPSPQPAPPPQEPRPVRDVTEIAPVVVEPSPSEEPVVDPGPVEEPVVEPSPAVEPTVEPSPTVEPPLVVFPPAPTWSGGFSIDWTSDNDCRCGPGVTLTSSDSAGGLLSEGAVLTATQKLRGAASDAEGDAAWALEAEYSVELTKVAGTLQLSFVLEHEGDRTSFLGSAWVSEVSGTPGDGGPMTYTLSGTYGAVGSGEHSPIRTHGSVSVQLSVWADGLAVYDAELHLNP